MLVECFCFSDGVHYIKLANAMINGYRPKHNAILKELGYGGPRLEMWRRYYLRPGAQTAQRYGLRVSSL